MVAKKFENSAKKLSGEDLEYASKFYRVGRYSFDSPSKLLLQWSRYFQAVISQAASFMLTGQFHDRECGIYKSEGGCYVKGFGDLVLLERCVYFCTGKHDEKELKIADMISNIVLNWDPNDPMESMVNLAASSAGCKPSELLKVVKKSKVGGLFGGDALSRFFRQSPFDQHKPDEEYELFCRVRFNGESTEKVKQAQADRNLGHKYLDDLCENLRKNRENMCRFPLCCSPSRGADGKLKFWINTGGSTQIDGWHSEQAVRGFIKNKNLKLVDSKRY